MSVNPRSYRKPINPSERWTTIYEPGPTQRFLGRVFDVLATCWCWTEGIYVSWFRWWRY